MGVYSIDGQQLNSVYNLSGTAVISAYDINGNNVLAEPEVDYASYTVDKSYRSFSISGCQGFCIYDNILFQFQAAPSGSNMATANIINLPYGSQYGSISVTGDHADSTSFSSEFYEEGDQFPLLYVTSDSSPAKVYVNRVTTTAATLIKTLSFPLANTGYYAAHAYDDENQIMYMVGYSQQNYVSDGGGTNKTVVSKWDMSSLTQNQDGTYTPTFISSYERPFIYVMQGQQFHDGMIWIASGYSAGSNVYAMNPADGTFEYTFDLETTAEVEGIDFMTDTEMVVGFQGGNYWKYTFALA